MNILYDHQTFSLQEFGGISRIYTELLKPASGTDVETELALLFSNNAYLRELKFIRYTNFLEKSSWKYKVPLLYNLNKVYSISKIKTANFQIFHPTYYDTYFLKYLKRKPFVVTVLDMIHEKLVYRYKDFALDKMVAGKKKLLQEASRVISISESTKKDIIDIFGIDESLIEVIYLGSSINRSVNIQYERLVNEDYILFIGTRKEYKNFSFFLTSIVPLLNEHKDVKVLCGGGEKFTVEENLFILNLGLKERVVYIPIEDDSTLINLYSNAACFVFPSLYEGFGIPVLEAFSCGCPCAISDSSSLPEVGGDAVLYFNPEDAHSILHAVSQLINEKFMRQEKIKKGYERLSIFSWNKTRQQTFQLYEKLL